MPRYTVELSDDAARVIEAEVSAGRQPSADAVLDKLLREERTRRDHLDALIDEGFESGPAIPVDEEFWRNAEIVMPGNHPKIHTGIRFDADMLGWFQAQGKGWQTRMNAVLRAYYEHNQRPS